MKTNLITTKDYLLLIDEEAEIKPDDYIIHDTVEGIVEANDEWDYRGEKDNYWNKVIAFYPLTKEAKELEGLPLLPSFEDMNYDELEIKYYQELEEKRLAAINFKGQVAGRHPDNLSSREIHAKVSGFIEGYKAAQDKQFTLDDVKKAIEMAREIKDNEDIFDIDSIRGLTEVCTYDWEERYSEEEIIQSLSTQQLPVSFEPEIELVLTDIESDIVGDDGEYIYINEERLKTITNSEGKQELVGTYQC